MSGRSATRPTITWNVSVARYREPRAGGNQNAACTPYGRGMSAKRLFMGPTPHQFAQASEESGTRMVWSFTEDQLLANSLEDLVQAVVDDKVPEPIVLHVESHQIGNSKIMSSGTTSDGGWASGTDQPLPSPNESSSPPRERTYQGPTVHSLHRYALGVRLAPEAHASEPG